MFTDEMQKAAKSVLGAAKAAQIRIVAVETVTSGLVSACLTSVSGASSVFERGFVLYHDSAKATGLGVSEEISARHGAVSAEVTRGLAEGGLAHSGAGISIAVTGYAGPGGGNAKDPVGTCYIAVALRDREPTVKRMCFSGQRDEVRSSAVMAALRVAASAIAEQ